MAKVKSAKEVQPDFVSACNLLEVRTDLNAAVAQTAGGSWLVCRNERLRLHFLDDLYMSAEGVMRRGGLFVAKFIGILPQEILDELEALEADQPTES